MRRSEIVLWTEELVKAYGRPRSPVDPSPLRAMYAQSDYSGMLSSIKKSMKLDMRLRIGYVKSGGPKNAPAWVSLPRPMPVYGSRAFRETQITVYIRERTIAHAPFEMLVAAMAHELAHVLLDATYHQLRRQEEAVDLTAMLFGYSRFFLTEQATLERLPRTDLVARAFKWAVGKELVTDDLTYSLHKCGYMSAEEIVFAQSLMQINTGPRV